MGLLHQFVEMLDEIGIDRFRRHKHQRHVLRLAGHEIALGDVLDMLADVGAHARMCASSRLVVARRAIGREPFEGKFRVDRERARIARQADDAIRTGAVRERELEVVAAGRQAVAHDRLHPALAEGAARLLVGENVLQRHHLARHLGQARLRRVDHRQPLIEPAERFARRLRLAFEPGAEPGADGIEPVGDDPGEVGLPRPQPFRHRPDLPVELGARLGEDGEPLLDRLLPFFRRPALAPPRGRAAPECDQRQRHQRGQQGHGRGERL